MSVGQPRNCDPQDSLAGAIQVYIRTNVFKPEAPQYQRAMTVPLPEASADTRVLVGWAIRALRRIYRPGYGYHKAGITLMEIVPRVNQQFSLFVPAGMANSRNDRLMDTLDAINGRYGRGVLRLAAEGVAKGWQMRRGNLSPRYTTEWGGVARVGGFAFVTGKRPLLTLGLQSDLAEMRRLPSAHSSGCRVSSNAGAIQTRGSEGFLWNALPLPLLPRGH